MKIKILPLLFLLLAACNRNAGEVAEPIPEPPAAAPQKSAAVNELAREYLRLELAMPIHDANHVDAYFGPAELQETAKAAPMDLAEIQRRAEELKTSLDKAAGDAARIRGLQGRLQALLTRAAMAAGEQFSFDDEAQNLFERRPPTVNPRQL